MQGDFFLRVRAKYNQLTKVEKKVADHIIRNPKDVLFMSISDLAEACGVGDTSVFRFCKTMSLSGYQEFKMVVSLSINDAEEGAGRLDGDIEVDDSFEQVAKKVLNTNINALTETYSLVNNDSFEQVQEWLFAARRICFFGVGASMLTAMKAMNKFMRIEPKVYCVQDVHMQSMVASMMSEEDLAIVISYSGATKDTVQVAKLARGVGAKVVCITRFAKSILTSYSDVILLCGANEGPLQGGSTSAEISQLFLIDLLYTEYYRRHFKVCRENNQKASESVMGKLY